MASLITIDELREFLTSCGPKTKIYLGVDSERYRENGIFYADYILAVVVHMESSKGCKIFAEVHKEKDYDQKKNRPFNRMMTEVRKVCDLYERLKDVLLEHDFEIHVDISPYETCGSHCAYQAAIGYVKGVTQQNCVTKPNAWCASFGADRAKELGIAQGYADVQT